MWRLKARIEVEKPEEEELYISHTVSDIFIQTSYFNRL